MWNGVGVWFRIRSDRLWVSVCVAVMAVCSLTAQDSWSTLASKGSNAVFDSPRPSDSPGVDSHTLYRSFFACYDRLNSEIEEQAPEESPERDRLIDDVARRHGIRSSEHQKVAAVSHAFVQRWKEIDSEGKAEASLGHASTQRIEVLRKRDIRRRLVLADAIQQLRDSMDAKGWAGLRSYINGEYRSHIHMATTTRIATQ